MATFQRLIIVFCLVFSGQVLAEDVPVQWYNLHDAAKTPNISRKAACENFVWVRSPTSTWTYTWSSSSCVASSGGISGVQAVQSCPAGISMVFLASTGNDQAVCRFPTACDPPNVRQIDGSCVAPKCIAGRILLSGPFADTDGDGKIPGGSCISGCSTALKNGGPPQINCSVGGAGTVGICTYVYPGDYEDTGTECQGSTAPPKDPPANSPPCPQCDCMNSGGSWGQLQGVDVCVPRGTPGSLPVQTKPPPTIKEEKPAPTPENPDPDPVETVTPSPVVTVTPSPTGGEPTVKEETTNPDGSTTTTTSTMGEYCKNNANSSTCKSTGTGNGGSGGGDFRGNCDTGFTCTGDGVQCAIARKIHEQRCEDLKGMEPFATVADAGGKVLRGETPQDVTDFLDREGDATKNINVGNLVKETGDFNFSGGCISDVSFSIGGHSISVPLSRVCPYFEMIGYFLLAAAYLAALRIVEII